MDGHWEREAAHTLVEADQAKDMIEVPVRKDDAAEVPGIDLEAVQIVDEAAVAAPRVEEQGPRYAVTGDSYQHRESVSAFERRGEFPGHKLRH